RGTRSRTARTLPQLSQRERAQTTGRPAGSLRTRTPRKLPANGAATTTPHAIGPTFTRRSSHAAANMGSRSGRQSVMLGSRRPPGAPARIERRPLTSEPLTSPTAEDAAEALAKLGPALVESGAIDQRTLERARRVAVETDRRLDRVLTQLGLISERGLAEAFSHLLGAPIAAASDYPDDPLFVDCLPAKFLRRAHALPIAASEERATLAMADPLDVFTSNAVAAAIGRPVTVAIAVPIELEAAIDRLYAE